jgi:hypothetical protein
MPVSVSHLRLARLLAATLLPVGCAEQKITAFNANPEVRFTSHDEGEAVPEGMPELFVAAATDPDHDLDELEATWEVMGTVVCESAPLDVDGETLCELTLGPEQSAISVRVRDPLDGVGGDTIRVDLRPTDAPSADIQRPEGSEVYYADHPVRFVVEVADLEDTADAMFVQWESSIDGDVGALHTPTTDGRLVDSVMLSEGRHGLTVVVTDSTGKTGSDATDIDVGPPNTAPSCAITAPGDDAVIGVDESLTLIGTAADPNVPADWLTATWTSDKLSEPLGTGTPSAEDGLVSLVVSSLPVEDHMITLRVEDERGASCTDVVRVTVTTQPQAEITAPQEGGRYYRTHPVVFAGQVSDTEDGPGALTAWWSSDEDGALPADATPDADGAIEGASNLTEGEHIITLTVQDADGAQGTDTVVIHVGPENTAPTCAITAPASGTGGDVAASLALEGTVDDVNEGPESLGIQWSSSLDDDLTSSAADSSGAVSSTVSGLSMGSHVISLTATDEVGDVCTAQITYEVGRAPVVSIVAPVDGAIEDDGAVVTFSATVSGADESATGLGIVWSSDLDGVLDTDPPDSAGSCAFTRSDLQVGTHTITLTATDALGLHTSELITLRINGIPSAPVVRIVPDPATTTDVLAVAFDTPSTDPDGGVITYGYQWTKDGVSAGTSGSVSPSATAKHQTWSVRVTPSDGDTDGPPGDASVSISNSPPVVAALTIMPTTLYTDDIATADLSVWDADGDETSLSYAWTVDGVAAGLDIGTLDGASWFDKGEVVGLTVTPADMEESGERVEAASVEVANSLPTAPVVFIDPEAPVAAVDDLWCRIDTESTDADGDAVSYSVTWTVDGVPFSDAVDTGLADVVTTILWPDDAVLGSETAIDETWTCTATPADDEASGAPGLAEVLILPAGPGCGDGNIDPGEEWDPAPGPYTHAPVDASTCRYDFSGIAQLYCNGVCDYGGAPGCDQADADVMCKLITDNPDAEASSYTVTSALSEPGFSGIRCGLGDSIEVDRGLDTIVGFQDFSVFATHGDGDVVAWPVCTEP